MAVFVEHSKILTEKSKVAHSFVFWQFQIDATNHNVEQEISQHDKRNSAREKNKSYDKASVIVG